MGITDSLQQQQFDVVIIGAGVAGAMSAILCSRAGLKTVLMDRQSFSRDKVCGCCLNGRAMQVLKMAALDAGVMRLNPSTTSALAIRYRGRKLDLPMPTSVAVSRRALDQYLVEVAISSGCCFVDNVTATVKPTDDEVFASESCSGERGAVITATMLNEANSYSAFDLKSSGQSSELRFVELRATSSVLGNSQHGSVETNSKIPVSPVAAKVVLVCDGLGHPSLHRLKGFLAPATAGSRIGLGAVFDRTMADDWIRPLEVVMAIGSHGYAGVVQIENNRLNLAAAIDPEHLNKTTSPLMALQSIFESAGVSAPRNLPTASIKGTVSLTRTAERIAGHRLFLLGDSTGYIEPFTGEGMAWALSAASAIIPLVRCAVQDGWSDDMPARWRQIFRQIVSREQKVCRLLSASLRRPWLLHPLMTTCQLFPTLTRRIVGHINRVPDALESS